MSTGYRGGVGEELTGLQRGPERLVQLGDELVGEANSHQHPHILRCCDHRTDPGIPLRGPGIAVSRSRARARCPGSATLGLVLLTVRTWWQLPIRQP